MTEKNPYSLSFGRIPRQYISRDLVISDILDALNSDYPSECAFKLTGIRGTGKTVTLTAIEKELKKDENWIVADLKSTGDVAKDLVSYLYSREPMITKFVDANLNLQAFGVGINLAKKSPIASIDVALRELLSEIRRHNRRVLVIIDELRKTDEIVDFIQEFQILIRNDLPIYLIVAGLYEDVDDVENTDGLTFFLRAESYDMSPLGIGIICEDYRETLGLSLETAQELANMTKGYAFAYQVFGKYMWDTQSKTINEKVLTRVDDTLARKVYRKIWSELSPNEKWFLGFIAEKDTMAVSELLAITKKKHTDWSRPRKRLIEKGVLDGSIRGEVSLLLPRFRECMAIF